MIEFSEQTSELFKSLSEFQKEVKQPKKDANNPFFKSKYVPLENVVEVIHQTASKHGLSELTYPAQDETSVGVGVIITHSSGQYIKFPPVLLKPDKNTPQGVGAAITYARRYALSSAFGIASETDDDGNSISGNETKPKSKPKAKAKTVNETQIKLLKRVLLGYAKATGNDDEAGVGKLESWALGQLGVENFSDIAVKDVKDFVDRITEMTKKKLDESQESLFEGSTTKPKA